MRSNASGVGHSIKAFAASLKFAAEGGGEHEAVVQPIVHHITWFQNAGVKLGAGIQIDGLAVMMMFVVTTISLLVHVYSTEYMRNDRRYTYFFAALSLFTASMLLLVVADNTLQLLVGWELVGLCSFMLIGHWWEEKPNSDAALKAFLTTRTGDIGLICGVIMTFFIVQRATGTGSFNIVALNEAALSGKVGHTLVLMTRDRAHGGDHGQERPVPAAHLAPRCHGRSDAGVRAHPRGDDGRRRRLPRCPRLPGVLRGLLDRRTVASTSWRRSAARP